MTWPKYVLIAYFAVSLLLLVANIGKPRTPLTPLTAALAVVLVVGTIALVVIA